METITCIFCKTGKEDRILIRENGFTGRKCDQCGLVYISPRPTLAEIEALYAQDQAHIPAETHKANGFIKRVYARHHLAILDRYASGGSLLEIGAGAGFFLDEARKKGFEVYGIEWNNIQVNFIREDLGIPCETGTLQDAFQGVGFDIIYHSNVISHFYDPLLEFTTMNRRLKAGGLLMFETGNGDFAEEYLSVFPRFQYPDHLFFFSEKNIADLLARSGFELLAVYKWSILPQLRAMQFLRRLRARTGVTGRGGSVAVQSVDAGSSHPAAATPLRPSAAKRALVTAAQRAFDISSYTLRYQVGRVAPKGKRPCTMIVVARKSAAHAAP